MTPWPGYPRIRPAGPPDPPARHPCPVREDYDEAARQYPRSLDVHERIGNQVGVARGYHQLGTLAQDRGDYDEAARQYQRSLDVHERIGNPPGRRRSYRRWATWKRNAAVHWPQLSHGTLGRWRSGSPSASRRPGTTCAAWPPTEANSGPGRSPRTDAGSRWHRS